MSLHIIVTVKQVIDPEIPLAAYSIDAEAQQVSTPSTFPAVLNGFDEHAMEAALRLKDSHAGTITVVSVGEQFALNIMRKTLAMGADNLILCQDPAFANLPDALLTAQILRAAITKIGAFDLILCGRQASDWDNAQVPLYLAEMLQIPCLTLAQKVEIGDGKVQVDQVVPDGYIVAESGLPALVTISNELGEPRYPTMRHIMAANRKRPTTWNLADLGLHPAGLTSQLEIVELWFPQRTQECEFVEAADAAEAGHQLAQTLRQAGLI
ncbi:Caffeyl-CoA reductase-Etf complex subunit CarD [Candidatus Entotheonellaceae bacterium PAL068K]